MVTAIAANSAFRKDCEQMRQWADVSASTAIGRWVRLGQRNWPLALALLCLSIGLLYAEGLITLLALYAGGILSAVLTLRDRSPAAHPAERDVLTGLEGRDGLTRQLDAWLVDHTAMSRRTIVMLAEIDDFKLTEEVQSREVVESVLRFVAQQIEGHLRVNDVAARLDGAMFAIAINPDRRLSFESALQLATRLQHAVSEPLVTEAATIRVSISIGFAMAQRLRKASGKALIQAATSALVEAQRNAPGAVRSFSDTMRKRIDARNALCVDAGRALESGQITAFFQPQLCMDTWKIAGFETLTRWLHPNRGVVSPADFLPALRQAGRMGDLGDLMTRKALDALVSWEADGFVVPRVGVNLSTEELRDPLLVPRIAEALGARDLSPERLVIEVLETVVAANPNDIVARNLAGLAELGCGIDLDDFGTGYASIANIRTLSIGRIKIDRSFVTRIDRDEEQQNMVAAILTMAERLGLETLAEGVETPGEQARLVDLGCRYAQGFLFARPMPLEETGPWITAQLKQSPPALPLRRKTG